MQGITSQITGLYCGNESNYSVEPKDPGKVVSKISQMVDQLVEGIAQVVPVAANGAIFICVLVMIVMTVILGIRIASRMLVSIALIIFGLLIFYNADTIVGILKGLSQQF